MPTLGTLRKFLCAAFPPVGRETFEKLISVMYEVLYYLAAIPLTSPLGLPDIRSRTSNDSGRFRTGPYELTQCVLLGGCISEFQMCLK